MQSIESIFGDPAPFLDRVFLKLKVNTLFIQGFELDHICYRVESVERYELLKTELNQIGELLAESQIGGRPIATYRLHTPIHYEGRNIPLFELPAPKVNRPYPEGFEHVEFVVDLPLEQFIEAYPYLEFDLSGMNKSLNRDVRLDFPGFCVKFHELSLDEVIQQEQQS